MKNITIGILGGMGTYATIHMFRQYAEIFPAMKEWERPRIVIDNRCTMPSRVRAFLFNENVDLLVNEMTESLINLKNSGCNRIILACNTSHLFLPQIFVKAPDLNGYIVHIIKTCVDNIANDNIDKIYLLGSEGTIESRIYQDSLENLGIQCLYPSADDYSLLRDCIEAVKQDKYSAEVKNSFLTLVNRFDSCILGCTELPILYEMYKTEIKCDKIYDPLLLSLMKIKEEFESE